MMVLMHTDLLLLVLFLSGLCITVLSFVFSVGAPLCLRSTGLGAELSKLLFMVEDQDCSQRRPHSHSKLYFRAFKAIKHHPQDSEEDDGVGHNSACFTEIITCPTEYCHLADARDARCKTTDNLNGSNEFELESQEAKKEEKFREEVSTDMRQQKIPRGDGKAEAERHEKFVVDEIERAVCKVEGKARSKAGTVQLTKVGTEERKSKTTVGKANVSFPREKGKTAVGDSFLEAEKRVNNIAMDGHSWNHSVGKELEQLIAKERGLAAAHGFIEL